MTLRLKIERAALFLFVGGISYGLLELLWRGRTHWTMLLLGGVCFLCIGAIRRKGFSLPLRSLLCALIVTALEFLTGCVVNLRLHWAVWDYSANRFQLLGQVCALYSFLWLLLSLPACALAKALDRFCERRFQAFGLRTRFPLFSAMRSRNDGTSSRRVSAGVNLRVRATKMR